MIYLLQPRNPRRIASGGYRFNAAIARRLEGARLGRSCELSPEELLAGPPPQLESQQPHDSDVVVIDSLFLASCDPPAWLDQLGQTTKVMLLMHFLPSANKLLDEQQRRRLAQRESRWAGRAAGLIATGRQLAKELGLRWQLPTIVATPGVAACFRRVSPRQFGTGRRLELVSVGAVAPAKGQRELVTILARMADKRPLRLTLVGDDGADPQYVRTLTEQAGSLQVDVVGNQESQAVAAYFARADLYVSTSRFESYGMSVAESLASRLPVLAYDVGEHARWVDEGANGHLVSTDDPEAFAEQLRRLVEEEPALEALSQNRRPHFFPTWEYSFSRFLAACQAPARCSASQSDGAPRRYSSCTLPTRFGEFELAVYRLGDAEEAILLSMGSLDSAPAPLVRVHSECFTGETLHSLKCDCGSQLDQALGEVARQKHGAVVYLRQEGRGIGLGDKVRAYAEQQRGADTVEANQNLDLPVDLRDYHVAAAILRERGVSRIRLNTNNPDKVAAMEDCGLHVEEVILSRVAPTRESLGYLRTKRDRLGHVGLNKEREHYRATDSTGGQEFNGAASQHARLAIFDLEGVILAGDQVTAQAHELLEHLRRAEHMVRFMTDSCVNTRATYAMMLRKQGLEVDPEHIYTGASLTARYVRDRCEKPVLALCGHPTLEEFEGLDLVRRDARTVIVGDFFDHYDAELLGAASRSLQQGASLVAMPRQRNGQNAPHSIDLGFWVVGLDYCAQHQLAVLGHRAAYSYSTVIRDAGVESSETILVSNELTADLEGARRYGIRTIAFRPGPVLPTDAQGQLQAGSYPQLAQYLLALLTPAPAANGKAPQAAM